MSIFRDMTEDELQAAVEGELQKRNGESNGFNLDFFQSIRRAGKSYIAARGKDPKKEGAALALYLLSDEPLGRGERGMLAQLVLGYWRRPVGKGPQTSFQQKEKIIAELRDLINKGQRKKAAKYEIAKKHTVTIRTIEYYESEVKEREEEVAKAQAKMKQSAHPAS